MHVYISNFSENTSNFLETDKHHDTQATRGHSSNIKSLLHLLPFSMKKL